MARSRNKQRARHEISSLPKRRFIAGYILNGEVGSFNQYARRRLTLLCGPPLLATELPIEAPEALTLMPQSPLCPGVLETKVKSAEMELQATSNLRRVKPSSNCMQVYVRIRRRARDVESKGISKKHTLRNIERNLVKIVVFLRALIRISIRISKKKKSLGSAKVETVKKIGHKIESMYMQRESSLGK